MTRDREVLVAVNEGDAFIGGGKGFHPIKLPLHAFKRKYILHHGTRIRVRFSQGADLGNKYSLYS